jgi:hypothetical protein
MNSEFSTIIGKIVENSDHNNDFHVGLIFVGSPSLSGSTVSVVCSVVISFAGFYLNSLAFPFYISWMKFLSW